MEEDIKLKSIIRRLTPVETSRLMGFQSDDYLDIEPGKTSDAPRYKACGNSWGVNSAEFVNARIEKAMRETGAVDNGRAVKYATTCSGVEAHSQAVRNAAWNAQFFSEIEPFPCRVLATRYPHVPNLGDMTKVDGTKYDLDVFSGGTPCFTKGAFVLTDKGYKPIEDIKVGDLVMTGVHRLRKVVKVGSKMTNDIVDASISGHGTLRSTHGHPYLVCKSHRRKSGEMYFDPAEFSSIGDSEGMYAVGIDSHNVSWREVGGIHTPSIYNCKTEDVLELCGWYLGDGYIRRFKGKNKKCVCLCLNAEKLAKFRERFCGVVNFSVSDENKPACKVQIACTKLADFLSENFGEICYNKRIPSWVYGQTDIGIKCIVDGYRATDGHSYKGGYGFTTTSPALAYGIADIIRKSVVCKHKVSSTTVIQGRTVNQRDWYRIECSHKPNRFHKVDGGMAVRIKKVDRVGGRHMVYNIEVEDDHTYIVNGLIVHNCQSVSVAGKRHGMAEDSGTRSTLAFHWLRIGREANAKILEWENVPGAYSSNGGRDFAWFVHRITEAGYGVAWRTLDVQHDFSFMNPRAIPQRRRRIWLVAVKDGNWQMAAQILFERSKYTGRSAPSRVLGDGTLVDEDGKGRNTFFNAASRADWIPLSEFPKDFGDARRILAKCGEIRYSGTQFTFDLFSSGEQTPDNFETAYLENIGAGAGVACGDCVTTLTMPEWTGGMQLPWGEKSCPESFNGTVCGLSDILLPWGDYLGKYLLSKRACEGICRRAEKRGKVLPQILKDALAEQIGNWTQGFLDKYLVKAGLVEGDGESEDEEDGGADGDAECDESESSEDGE